MSLGKVAPIVLALALAYSAPAFAQAAPPFRCSDTVSAALGSFTGTWQVRALFRSGPGTWDSTVATSRFSPELGGCVLRQEYWGTRYGEAYHFLAMWGANGPPGGRIQRFFAHSLHGIFTLAAGAWRADTLVLEDRELLDGRSLIQQSRITRPSGGRFIQVDRRSTDEGGTWTETFRASYTSRTP